MKHYVILVDNNSVTGFYSADSFEEARDILLGKFNELLNRGMNDEETNSLNDFSEVYVFDNPDEVYLFSIVTEDS